MNSFWTITWPIMSKVMEINIYEILREKARHHMDKIS